jgi:glycosyltransferase involved in cell wall biosynthesis
MKILWLAHRDPLNPKAGGAERTIFEVGTRLAKRGYDITLLTGGWKGCPAVEELNGIQIHRFGKKIAPHLALPIFLLKNHYNLVVNDLGHAVPWISSSVLGKKNVVFFRHLHARSLPGQVIPIIAKLITSIEKCYPIIYHKATFVTESSTSKNDLIRLGIGEQRIFVNPPGVDRGIFHPVTKTSYPTIVYFGGMRRYKRPQESILLLRNLINQLEGIKLFIIGSGPEEKALRKLTSELNLQDRVIFKGRVSNIELSDIVASSWLNVHASVTEGWGYSILEASSAGTPTVAYRVPGVSDSVEIGYNGIAVENGNKKALAEAAFSILTDPGKWWSSSIEVAKKYSWDSTAEIWDGLINKLADE